LVEQALRCGESIVGDDVVTTVNIDGNDLSPVSWLGLASDFSLVEGITALGSLLGGIAGSPDRHRISPVDTTESRVISVAILTRKRLPEEGRRLKGPTTSLSKSLEPADTRPDRRHVFRREELYEASPGFLREYRKAAKKLKAGDPPPLPLPAASRRPRLSSMGRRAEALTDGKVCSLSREDAWSVFLRTVRLEFHEHEVV
jgi:hypothetical protein